MLLSWESNMAISSGRLNTAGTCRNLMHLFELLHHWIISIWYEHLKIDRFAVSGCCGTSLHVLKK